jgi:zinc/manganese transport system substrate-binding protein
MYVSKIIDFCLLKLIKFCYVYNREVVFLRKLLYVLISLIIIVTAGCNKSNIINEKPANENIPKDKEEYLKIMTSSKLVYHMIKDIVGDRHMIDYMLKDEEEQWNFKYTEDSLNNVSRKDLFIYIGAGYEHWIHGFVEELKKSKVGIVNLSRGIRISELSSPTIYEGIEFKENPYYWLSPDAYKIALFNIKNSIQERDPKSRDLYEKNFNTTIQNLDKYSDNLKGLMKSLQGYTFVTSEDDFDYLTDYLNMKVIKINESYILQSDKAEDKLQGIDNMVFLFSEDEILKQYKPIIDQYKMKTADIMTYKFDNTVEDILKYDYDSLYKLTTQ